MIFRHLHPVMAAGFILTLFSPLAAANSPEQIFAQVSPSIVVVDIVDATGKSIGLGSGVVTGTGQVITNCHVAQKGDGLQVRQSGKTFKASLQFADSDRDLCQLSVPDLQVHPITLGTAKKLKVGQRVYAIGAPQGLELTLSEGLVSSLREYEGSQYIQTSAAISPGSSGGGLFDDQGRLIGITTFYLAEGQNLNFALPVDWIGEVPKRGQAAAARAKKGGLDWLVRAIVLDQEKDWKGMLKHAQQWVKSEPENATAWAILGATYINLTQYDQAIPAYREALRILPEYSFAWSGLGRAQFGLKQYDQAIQSWQEALRIQPEDADAWYNLGNTHFILGQQGQAIPALREAMRIQPEKVNAWQRLGMVYFARRQFEQAIPVLQEALRIQPEEAITWEVLGSTYFMLHQYDKVREIYQTLRRLNPAMADKYFSTFEPVLAQ